MFTTVPRVAPAPGRPHMNPAIMLPMPWPTSSLSGLCRVRVIASATSDVSRLSMEPSSAMINAGCTDRANTSTPMSGICRVGRPVGTSPMTGVIGQPQHAEKRPRDQRGQRRRYELTEPTRPDHAHHECDGGDSQRAEVDVDDRVRQRSNGPHRPPPRRPTPGRAVPAAV